MGWGSYWKSLGNGSNASPGLIASMVTTQAVPAGYWALALVAKRSSGSGAGDYDTTREVIDVRDQLGNGWQDLGQHRYNNGDAGTGVALALFGCRPKVAIPIGTVIKATFDSPVADKAILGASFQPSVANMTIRYINRLSLRTASNTVLGFTSQTSGTRACLHVHAMCSEKGGDWYNAVPDNFQKVTEVRSGDTGGEVGVTATLAFYATTESVNTQSAGSTKTGTVYKCISQWSFIEVPIAVPTIGVNF